MSIKNIGKYVDQVITLKGFVANTRGNKKIRFINFRDGSGFIQVVAKLETLGEEVFNQIMQIGQESSVIITGLVLVDTRSKLGFEINLQNIEVIKNVTDYPITPKEHGTDFLMNNRHLWLRSSRQQAALSLRSTIISALHNFFDAEKFTKFDVPFLMGTSAEGGSEVFKTDYFGQEAFLTQSGQLYAEAGAYALGKVWTLGPTFRAEESKTKKHLTEFWMLEPEVAFNNHEDNMKLQEKMIKYVINFVLENCTYELNVLQRNIEELQSFVKNDFAKITYTEAIEFLNTQDETLHLNWGEDFGAPHEKALAAHFGCVFIEKFPTAIKAFYMQPDPNNKDVVLADDLLVPEFGEIIGGSQRINDYELLKSRLIENNLSLEEYGWYLDLREFGGIETSGFGLGLERLICFIGGLDHIREAIPFARFVNRIKP